MSRVALKSTPLIDIDLGIGRQWGYNDRVHAYHVRPLKKLPSPPPNRGWITARCHPNRKHEARGLCKSCYARWWRRRRLIQCEIESRFETRHLVGSRT